nr:immunoglobulin heavy chain junction region [Macaca mulatta]MOW25466.1 immunoglobulin heavy chain junction region [Macaca mulatta]
CLAAYSWNDYW